MCRPRSPQAQQDTLEIEADIGDELGLDIHVIDTEDVVDGQLDRALERLPQADGCSVLYRGWMLTGEEYDALHEALEDRGYYLSTPPEAYVLAHYLPHYHEHIAEHTAPSVWTWGTDLDEAWEVAQSLGDPPWLLKDHVKSAKERWSELGTIPTGCSRTRFDRICTEFIEHRGDRFERGLCFRRLLPLRRLGVTDMGYPIHDEHRLFFWEGDLVASAPQHDLRGARLDPTEFGFLGERIESPFFTADVARLEEGRWTIVELGDGGVSMLPSALDPRDLYRAMIPDEL